MFEKEIAEGWELVEYFGSYETNKGDSYYITRWFNESMNADTYVVIDDEGKSCGAYMSYEDAEKCAENLAEVNSYDLSGCY